MAQKTPKEIVEFVFRSADQSISSYRLALRSVKEAKEAYSPKWVSADIVPAETAKPLPCLVLRNGKYYHETCIYFNKFQEDIQDYDDDDFLEFQEHDDTAYLPAGWYVLCDHCEKYMLTEVAYYMTNIELPELPVLINQS